MELDGSGSDGGPWGTNVTYSWSQTSGPTSGVTFDDDTSATPVVTIPALTAGTELTFTLTVAGRATDTSFGTAPDTDTATVTVLSTDATLSALTVNDGTTDHTIDLTTTPYTQTVGNAVTTVTLTATPAHTGASVSAVTLAGDTIDDDVFTDGITVPSLIEGANVIVVTVTAEDGVTVRTYTLTVAREVSEDGDATGKPTISGAAQVGVELTATTSGIMDADGKTNADNGVTGYAYTYQWILVDGTTETDIAGETGSTYTPVATDVGHRIKVRVSFTDDAGNPEEPLPSDATVAAVVAAAEDCAVDRPGNDWCATMTVGVSRTGSIIVYGFIADSFGQLDYTTIDYGPSYGVEWITANETGGNDYVAVSLSARVALGSVFNLGGREFTADADSEQGTLGLYNWNLPTDFGWIDGQKVTVSANLAPAPESATVDGTTLVLTHAEDLDTGSTPAAGSYTVKLGGSAGPTVSSVAVDARTVTLTLATAITAADTNVTVTYTAPVSSPLQDVSGLDAPDSEDFPVTNNTGATNTIPVVDNPIPDQAATVGMAFSYEFPAETFNDDDGDTLTYMATKDDDNALPSWLTFDDTTRTFSGTPQGGDVGTVTVKVTASDGEGATVSDEFDIVVSAANSAPTSADNTVTTDEDTAYTFAAADFNFDDTDSGDALASVTLVTLPAAGALELDGAAVSVDQVVAEVDIVKLTFTPALNANGLGYASFTFKVNDGTADSVDAYTMTVNVTPVNDAATGAPEITGTPQVGQALTAGMDTIADAEDLPTTTFPLGYSFQWVRVAGSTETDLTGETNITYSPASADEGNTIKVKVSFTDGAGNSETVPSDAVGPVVPAAGACITGHDWCATMTVEVETDEQGDITFVGFSHTGLGTLNPNTISYGSKHYETLSVRWTPDSPIADLEIIFEVTAQNAGDLPSGSVFGFDEIERTEEAGKSVYNNPGEYAWDDLPTDFGWIDGQKVTVSANLAPAPESATVDGTTLVLTHAEDLDTGSTPAAGSYTVKLGGSAGPTVSSVAVDARTVTLTLATAITAADTDVTVDYDAPVSSPLQDVSGLDAPDFEDFEVTNNTATSNDATLSALTVNDGTTDHTIDLTTTPYTQTVGNAVTTVTLTATPTHTGAEVSAVTLGGSAIADTVFTDGITVPSLVEGGANVIVVTVTAEDGTTMQTYTVTITDDDESMFTVIAAPTSIAEDGGATTVTVSTGGVTFADDRQIALTLTGTATKGTDYTVDSETLTLTAGETSVATMVTAVQDAVDEEDETIDITAEGAQTRVTITDDDESMFTVIAAPTSIAEDGGATTVTVSTGGVTFADDRQIALTLTGTATKGTDYTVDSETLTLTAGETSVATMVTAVDDAVDEEDETIDITAEGAQTRVTITDDDESMFTVIAAPTSIAEDGGATTVTVSTGGVTFADDRQIALTLTGTATKGTDYTVDSETLTLTAGETSVATMVTAVQDAVDEEDETIDITAEGAQTRVTITDDDESMFTVIAAPTSIAEDGGATTVTVSTGGVTFADDRQIALTLTGTATKGTDYTVDSETLTLTAGETSVATMVTAVQDAVDEEDETIDITAEGAQTRVTITDDDESMFTVIAAPTSIAEDGGATTVTVSTGGVTFADDRQIALTLTGTATKGTDYTVDSETLTLTAGETSVATMVTAVQDAVDEEDETIDITAEGAQTRVTITDDDESMFTVIAAPTSIAEDGGATTVTVSTGGVTFADDRQIALTLTGTATKGTDYTVDSETLTLTAGETSVATMVTAVQDAVDEEDETIDITAEGAQTRVTITDDDESMFTVIAAPTSIAEDGGATTVTVSTGGVTFADDRQIALTLTGTATKGTDYTVDSETLTLTAGETSVATMVTAVQDAVDEEDETIDITAEGAQTRVTITDDDESMFTVIAAPTSIAEDGGATTVTVSTGGVTFADDRQIALTLTGTATKGTDYTVDSETLTLTAGETSVATMVTAVDDAVDEEDETIDITAEGAQTRVTITDDDESMFTVIAAPTSIAEDGGATTVTVSTGGVTFADDRQIALTLTGTATKGTDYTVDSETLTLTAGETSVATMVTAVQDAVDEEDETIDITAEGAQTRVTITDDDESMFTVIAAPTSIAEDGGATTVTVSTGGVTFADDRQIALTLTGTATKGTDYTVDSETLTLTAGETSVATMVTAVDDAVDEEDETIDITAEGAQTRVTITDDDESMFTVIAAPTSIAEDGGATTVTVSTGGVTFADDRQIALTLTGTATKGTDYTVDSETLTLTAGETSVATMVTAVDDAVDEEDETIDITAEGAQTRVTITDDDESMFTVIAAPTSIAEDGGATTVTVSTGGVTFADDRQIALTLTGTATKGTDYTVDSETLTLTAGETSVATMVTAVQDAVDEEDETIDITAEGAQTRVTITDDDESMFTVIAAPTSIAEDGGATTVTVSTGGVTFADDRQIALTLTGTATKGTDYTVDSETLTLTAGETSVATMVTAVDDAVDEEDETIDITAEGAQTRVTITDDDESMFTVIAAPTSIAEDGGATTVTVSTGGVTFADDRQIALTLTGTATKGTDYTVDSETLTLTAGETSVATMVTAVQDAVDEEDETIDITAEGAQTRVTITDDDESMFTVIAAPTSIAEDGGATTVTVSTGGVTFADDRQIALTLTGTATKGTDYTVDSETLTLTAGETSVATMVTAVQDAVDEEDETIDITAEGAQTRVTITDDDESMFTVIAAPTSIAEDGGATTVTVSTGGVTFADDRQIALTLTGTATKGTDYTVDSETLTLTAGETSVATMVTAVQDAVDEEDETIDITAEGAQTRVTITDDDESMFTVIAAPTSIAEDGGATTVTVSTGGVTFADDRQIALTLTGTATKGTDYTVDSETLTLTAGETSVATMVTAVQDAVDEEDETIDITAEGAQTRVTITDDDESMFTVIAAPTSIAEDGGATTVTVSTGGVTFADDRQIALTLTGTATKGTDYTVDSETLTLTAGETSVATMVTAVDDAVDEEDETIDITAEGAQTRVTITDDDESMFTVIAAPTSIAEDGGATTVTVSTGGMTFADDRQIALTLTGTATKGTDYTVDSETLTLTAGETSVATMVTAVDDAVDEEDETIDITAEGAQTRVTITDDDESMFTVIAAPTSIAEDGGATTVTVSTGGVTFADDRQIALTLTGTATKGTDYTVDSETLTLTAGTTSVTTMVTAVQDAVDEEDETIDITAEGAQTRVTITDDDESMFTVIAAPTSIAEDGGATTVTVSTGGVTFADDRQIALTLTGTATKGTDYTVDSETLTLTAGETSVATMVTAVDDAVDEGDETIDITAEGAQTRVTITDDDESMFTVIAAPTSIAEDGGATTVTVSTGGVTFADDRQIALTLTGTATKGTDYTVDSETLTLTAGETSVATMVTAVDDAVDEGDETIDITAEGAQETVTITDDDEPGLDLSKTSLGPEEGGRESYTVALETQPTAQVTV